MTKQNKIHRERTYMEMLVKCLRKHNQRVDTIRLSGEWKYEEFPDCGQVSTRVVCPFCGRLDIIYDWQNSKEAKECHDKEERNFCPKCGADMRGREDVKTN